MGRIVRIELMNSRASYRRLCIAYETSVREARVTERFEGEVATMIRAIHAALDKLANRIWTQATGKRSDKVSYPIAFDREGFQTYTTNYLGALVAARPDVVDALERTQPYVPGFELMRHMVGLYRTEAHHAFTMTEFRQDNIVALRAGGGTLAHLSNEGLVIGAAPFAGLPVTGKSHTSETMSAGLYRDIRFVTPSVSVISTLVAMHNCAVRAFADVGSVAGLDLPGNIGYLQVSLPQA